MPSRRTLLVTGAASAVLIGGGLFALDIFGADTDAAREPWRAAAEGFGDPRLDILAYAILAPNPHNRQPWLIELIGEDRIRIHPDLDRMLPETDPPRRQIVIGFGAFLELLRMAAAEKGYRAEIDPFPRGAAHPALDRRPVADIRLVRDGGAARDPLFAAALDRRTNREPYDMARPLAADAFEALAGAIGDRPGLAFAGSADAARCGRLREIAKTGWLVEYRNRATHRESNVLTRIGADEINAHPDGIALDGPMIEAAANVGVVTREKLADPDSYAYQEGIRTYTAMIDATPSFGWLTSLGNDRLDQLDAGAAWVRIHLRATQLGVALQPLSQVLQEFPAMADQYQRIHEELAVEPPARIQGLFRLGYGPERPPAPRWPLTSRLIRR